jgi:heptosyltransferase I
LATRDHSLADVGEGRRVLIVRIGAMGDVLHAMPAVAALKKAHPEWRIGWVVEPRWVPLLKAVSGDSAATPLVDQTYIAATRRWKQRPVSRETLGEIASLRRELRDGRFDLCVDMQGSIRSAAIGRMAGTREFAGPADPREGPARWLYKRAFGVAAAHVIEQGCELLGAAAGLTLRPEPIGFPIDVAAEHTCDTMLERLLPQGGPFVLIAPTAGWGAKQWPAERFGTVAAELGRRGIRTLVNAAGGSDPVADEVVRSSEGYAAATGGDLPQLIALTRRASAVIAGDTGPLHLAAALERPVVALFGPTDPARNGPYGTRAWVLRHGEERRDHRRLAEPEAGLLAITVDEVVAAALELLRARSSR